MHASLHARMHAVIMFTAVWSAVWGGSCLCRGRKTVMRFLPNTAADLEPVLALLERLNAAEVRSGLPSRTCTAEVMMLHA